MVIDKQRFIADDDGSGRDPHSTDTDVEVVRDPGRAVPGKTLDKDPPHMPGSGRIRLQSLQPATPPRMRDVRVRSGIDQLVAVWWAAAQIAALLHQGIANARPLHALPEPTIDQAGTPISTSTDGNGWAASSTSTTTRPDLHGL